MRPLCSPGTPLGLQLCPAATHAGREMPGVCRGDLDLPFCWSAETFCEEKGDDTPFRRYVTSFHLKDSLKSGGH